MSRYLIIIIYHNKEFLTQAMKKQNTRALILAAGKGTRMRSSISKVLHKILDKTIIEYVVDALEFEAVERIGVVVGAHNLEQVRAVLKKRVDYIVQQQQLGTGHAVTEASHWLSGFEGSLVIVVGDAPFISKDIIQCLMEKQQEGNNAVCFLTTVFDNPPPWGRVIRNNNKQVIRIVEEKDATAEEKKIKEVSSSHYCFDWQKLKWALGQIGNDNTQGEYYLPDVIERLVNSGYKVKTEIIHDFLPSFGINTPEDLKFAGEQMKKLRLDND